MNSIIDKIKKIWPYLAIGILLLLLLHQCNRNQEIQQNRYSAERFLSDTLEYYQNELSQEIAQKEALQGDMDNLEILLSEAIDSTGQLGRLVEKYKNIASAGNITTITKIDTVFLPYETPVDYEFERAWRLISEDYKISGLSNHFGTQINNLEIPNTLSFAVGEKKVGFFKREFRVEVVNSNQYIRTIGADVYSFSEPIKRFNIGPYVGYDPINGKVSYGVGVTYGIIRF